ncbi:MAG: phosphatidylserine/phosphatidylglycerophosphate/cardiolipin synthase family protein [Betaproteobacteria bacterium]|nr:phosphatidylserine/phosphatidylglycerophosphate/cardiolipin synthase family protein [Betaproteobacteria bacterium]
MISALQPENAGSKTGVLPWSHEMLLVDGKEYFPALLHEISQAQKSIAIETYIFENEALGREMVRALNAAQARGVQVRLLVDGVGSAGWISDGFRTDESLSFEVRVYHPLPWQILPSLAHPRGPGVDWIFRLFSYVNSRNHRKVALIDERVAFVGSLNLSDAHMSAIYGDRAWHDVGVRLEGGALGVLADAFQNAWQRGWRVTHTNMLRPSLLVKSFQDKKQHPLVIRNDGRLLRHKAWLRRLRFIRQARERIWIANAYFVPSGALQKSLVAAARRGVDVRLLLPSISDVNFMPWVARAFYASLIQHGVRLFEYQPRILHAKVMYVDDCVAVGSSNLNHRSVLHDAEIDVILENRETVARVKRMFEQDFMDAVEVGNHSLNSLPVWKGLFVKFLLYFRHIL